MSINLGSDFIAFCLKSAATTMQSLQSCSQENQEKLNLCRFCAVLIESGGSIDVINNTEVFHEYLHMIEVLKIDYLHLDDLKLPETICMDCHINFKTAYNFFNRVRVSQTLLNALYCDDTDNVDRESKDHSIVKMEVEEDNTVSDDIKMTSLFSKEISNEEALSLDVIDHNIVKIEVEEDNTVSDDIKMTSLFSKENSNKEAITLDVMVPADIVQSSIENQVPAKGIYASMSLTSTRMGNHNISSTKLPMLTKNVSYNTIKSLLQNSPNRTVIEKYENTSDSKLNDVKDIELFTPANLCVPVLDTRADLRHENLFNNMPEFQDLTGETSKLKKILENNEEKEYIEVSIEPSRNVTNYEEVDRPRPKFEESSKHCMVSVPNSVTPVKMKGSDKSWTSYPWACKHCTEKFENMSEVREHSKIVHGMCYGYHCAYCIDQFNMFNAFVEHVRQHRDDLRYYCQFCNLRCKSQAQCSEHALSHWTDHKICGMCGEMLKDADALRSHRASYKRAKLPRRDYRKRPRLVTSSFTNNGVSTFGQTQECGWHNYKWTCLECHMRLSSAESLRAHARDFHEKCFAMKCADCLMVLSNYRMFVAHVTIHRPYLKNYCQYCNEHFETYDDQNKHVNDHMTGPQKPCDGCGQIFENKALLLEHMRKYDPPRIRGTVTTEDMTCDLCAKVFQTMGCFRAHRKTHAEERKRDHICDTCGKAFFNAATLKGHVALHSEVRSQVCELCKKEFKTKSMLKAHVRTHLGNVSNFICDECGKSFRKKENLKCHIYNHMDLKLFPCLVCTKRFKHKFQLNTHMNQHTGLRPYSCKHCEKTFTNWPNCNKHMIRKHGDTLAKTKLTSQGRLNINKETGMVDALRTDKRAEQWVNQILKREKGPNDSDKIYVLKTT